MKIEKIKTESPFKDLFPIVQKVLDSVRDHMRSFGYDKSQPVVIWKNHNVIIDGHTRFKAAQTLKIKDIPVHELSFEDEDEALSYAIHNQRDRRNLTDADILRLVVEVDKRKKTGPKNLASSDANSGKSASGTAKVIGTSPRKVEKARTVIDHAPENVKEAVKSGKMTINKALKETKESMIHEPKSKAMFNETNENIEWAHWSWNPVVGCEHGCPYCYARDIANRFYGSFKPKFFPERLQAPRNMGIPKGNNGVFVCSMADLFGKWVPKEWIDAVLKEVTENPAWNFIFLTKNPKRYLEFSFPKNSWIGTTIDRENRMEDAIRTFEEIDGVIKFISFEPLLEEILFDEEVDEYDPKVIHSGLDNFDWIIIGGQSESTGMPAMQPKWDWVESLWRQARNSGCKWYWKPNLLVRPKEFPETAKKILRKEQKYGTNST